MLDKTFAFLQGVEAREGNRQDALPRIWNEAMNEVKLLRSMPEIVLLVGSARFKQAFEEESERIVFTGAIVLGKHVFKPGADWNVPEPVKDYIHAVQFRMCDLANRVHVVNVDGYVGQDTYNLLRYAIRTDKTVTFLEPNVKLLGKSSQVKSEYFLKGTVQRVEFEEAAFGS